MLSKTQILACYIRKVAILKVMLETERGWQAAKITGQL